MADILEINNWGGFLLQHLYSFYVNSEHCEFCLICKDEKINVHRAVLCAASDFFSHIESNVDTIVLPDEIDLVALKAVISFMYTGKLEFAEETKNDLVYVINFMQIPVLQQLIASDESFRGNSQDETVIPDGENSMENNIVHTDSNIQSKQSMGSRSSTATVKYVLGKKLCTSTSTPYTSNQRPRRNYNTNTYNSTRTYMRGRKQSADVDIKKTSVEPLTFQYDQEFTNRSRLHNMSLLRMATSRFRPYYMKIDDIKKPLRFSLPEGTKTNYYIPTFSGVSYSSCLLQAEVQTYKDREEVESQSKENASDMKEEPEANTADDSACDVDETSERTKNSILISNASNVTDAEYEDPEPIEWNNSHRETTCNGETKVRSSDVTDVSQQQFDSLLSSSDVNKNSKTSSSQLSTDTETITPDNVGNEAGNVVENNNYSDSLVPSENSAKSDVNGNGIYTSGISEDAEVQHPVETPQTRENTEVVENSRTSKLTEAAEETVQQSCVVRKRGRPRKNPVVDISSGGNGGETKSSKTLDKSELPVKTNEISNNDEKVLPPTTASNKVDGSTEGGRNEVAGSSGGSQCSVNTAERNVVLKDQDGKVKTIKIKSTSLGSVSDQSQLLESIISKYPHLLSGSAKKANGSAKHLLIINKDGDMELKDADAFDIKNAAADDTSSPSNALSSSSSSLRRKREKRFDVQNTDGPWLCHHCGGVEGKDDPLELHSYYDYRQHFQRAHGVTKDDRYCDYCGAYYRRRTSQLFHLYVQHGVEPPANIHFPGCDECNYIAVNHAAFARHILSHKKKSYVCSCKKSFHDVTSYVEHQKVCKRINNSEYKCSKCNVTFDRFINLKAHIRISHKEVKVADMVNFASCK